MNTATCSISCTQQGPERRRVKAAHAPAPSLGLVFLFPLTPPPAHTAVGRIPQYATPFVSISPERRNAEKVDGVYTERDGVGVALGRQELIHGRRRDEGQLLDDVCWRSYHAICQRCSRRGKIRSGRTAQAMISAL